ARPNLGMPVAFIDPASAKGYPVEHRDIVLDNNRLARHEAGGMVKKNSTAKSRCRVNIGPKFLRGLALKIKGQVALAPAPEQMRDPVGLDGCIALEKKERLKEPA